MKTYLRCVYANKFTFVGYICLLIATVSILYLCNTATPPKIIVLIGIFTFFFGSVLLVGTDFGRDTLLAYNRAIQMMIARPSLKKKKLSSTHYCNRVGAALAREDILKESK